VPQGDRLEATDRGPMTDCATIPRARQR
jgi:hypothetical protein